jgi:phasin family protein
MAGVKEFVAGQAEGMAKRAQELRKKPVAAARDAAAKSAETLKSMKDPVRAFARSGVKLTTISQGTAQSLIELQERIVASALNDAAEQLERAATSQSLRDALSSQASVLMGARERIVADMAQALAILRDAGGDVREVASRTYGSVAGKTGGKQAAGAKTAKTAKRKPARRKSTARKAKGSKASGAKTAGKAKGSKASGAKTAGKAKRASRARSTGARKRGR